MNTSYYCRQLVSFLIALILSGQVYGEHRTGKVALRIADLQTQKTNFQPVNIFERAAHPFNESATATIENYTLLNINASALNNILLSKPEFLRLIIPSGAARVATEILLYKVNISQNGFTLETSDGRRFDELNPIVHYRGIISGDMNSVVGISFSKEEIMGLICNDEGNYVLGELENVNTNEYVFYNDKNLVPDFNYECGANTMNPVQEYKNNVQNNQNPVPFSVKCVDWYYEIDYDIFVGKGSLANVNSYIQGVFNQVSTLYDNDGISITLQTLYVWTATDPYTGPTTSNYLNQFGAYRTSFAGDLANLVGYAGGGGVAYVNGLCASNTSYRMGYMGISSSFNTVPTYSWTVEVVTHEDGHLLGSRHTHDCVWNGNNTRIDNCGPQAGYSSGSCAAGPMPSSGTIMSYCHLVGGVGINFNNGFGPQPTTLMLNNVNNASCLSACTSCPTPSQPGTIAGNTTYCGSGALTYSVVAVGGATSYVWTLPSGWSGTSTTNSINVTTSGNGGTISVIAVNSCGNSTARTLTVTGNTQPVQPGNLSGSTSVCQGTSQTYSVSPVNGATSYIWTKPAGWSGTSTSNSLTVIPGSGSGNVSVVAVNSCGNSTARTISVAVSSTPAQPLSISGQTVVCSNISYSYSVPSVSGATSYNWVLPSGWSGSSTTNNINVISGSTAGTISVSATNSCGTSSVSSLSTSTSIAPLQPNAISTIGGTKKVCPGDVVSYSIQSVAGSTSYLWTAPVGGTISSGQGTTSVTISYNTAFVAQDTLRVSALNGCAESAARKLSISRNTPVKPSVIAGPKSNGCNTTGVPYSVLNVAGMTYNWSFTSGSGTVASGQGTNIITANFGSSATTNALNVSASNSCGVSAARILNITSNPGQPGLISGTTTPCANQFGVPYSITPVAGATSYTWAVPSGARINDGIITSTGTTLTTTSTNVTVNFKTTSGNVRVKTNNLCGTGTNRSLAVTFGCRLNEASDDTDFLIYPNPAAELINIKLNSTESGNYKIQLKDLAGKLMMNLEGETSSDENELRIDVSELPSGIYFVQINLNGKEKIEKLVKL